MGKLSVVVGGQYGSEAKGTVTAFLARTSQGPTVVVRVAGPNAGHTAYDPEGRAWALRQIPVGMVVNPDVVGVIADGSEIDVPVLVSEIIALEEAGINILDRLAVSVDATLLTDSHRSMETQLGMSGSIGSTAKGIGAARADRIMRMAETYRTAVRKHGSFSAFCDYAYAEEIPPALKEGLSKVFTTGLSDYLSVHLVCGSHVVIEGTQGFGLGVHQPHYPQTTSSDTRAIDFLAMAGLNPWDEGVEDFSVWVVARAYPIRVAGNSGPLYQETTWAELGLPEEKTTVTKKVRRVGCWDQQLFDRAVVANGRGKVTVAYTMADQEFPYLAGLHGSISSLKLTQKQADAISEIINRTHGLVDYIGTSPNTQIWGIR